MSEIGAEVPKISIEEKVQVAKKAFQEGNDTPAVKIINYISGELSHRIESGESSDDPLAYSLKSVVTNGLKDSLIYLLEPPVNPEADRKIKMVYVTQGENPRLNNVVLLDIASEADPYDEFATNDIRSFANVRYGTERILFPAFLDDIAQVYDDIAAHGIRKNPADCRAIHRGSPSLPKFALYIKSLPFAGKLEFSPEHISPEEQSKLDGARDARQKLFEKQRQIETERMKTLAQQTLAVADQIIDDNGLSKKPEGNTLFTLFHGSPHKASFGLKSLEEVIKEGNDINKIDINFQHITDTEYTTPEPGLLDAYGRDKSDKYGYPKPDQIALNLTKEFLTRLNFPLDKFRNDPKGNPYMIDLARSCKVIVKRTDNGSRILGFEIQKVSLPPPGYH